MRSRITSLAVALVLLLSALCLAIAGSARSIGYEPNLYESVPLAAWVALVLAYSLSSILCVAAFSAEQTGRPAATFRTLIAAVVPSAVLVTLPVVRYQEPYGFYDILAHIGLSRLIYDTGSVNLQANFYPTLHLFAVALSFLTGMPIALSIELLRPVIVVIQGAGAFLLIRGVVGRDSVALTAAYLAVLPSSALGNAVAPFFLALALTTLLLRTFTARSFSPSKLAWSLATVVLFTSITVAHVLVAVATAAAVVVTLFESGLARMLTRQSFSERASLTMILGVLPLVWVFFVSGSYQALLPTLRNMISAPMESPTISVSSRPLVPFALAQGPALVLLALDIGVFIRLLLLGRWHNLSAAGQAAARFLATSFFVFFAFYAVLWIIYGNEIAIRLFWMAIVFSAPFISIGLTARRTRIAGDCEKPRRKTGTAGFQKRLATLSVAGMVSLAGVGVVGLFPSPFTGSVGMQNTVALDSGLRWAIQETPNPKWILSGTQGVGVSYADFYFGNPDEFWVTFAGSRYALLYELGFRNIQPGAHRDLPFTIGDNPYFTSNTTIIAVTYKAMAWILGTDSQGNPLLLTPDRQDIIALNHHWVHAFADGDADVWLLT